VTVYSKYLRQALKSWGGKESILSGEIINGLIKSSSLKFILQRSIKGKSSCKHTFSKTKIKESKCRHSVYLRTAVLGPKKLTF
jgi:hypothetical protein